MQLGNVVLVMAHRVLYLTNRTQHEPKRDPRPEPAIFQNATSALKVEHMSAVQLGFLKKETGVKHQITTTGSETFTLFV